MSDNDETAAESTPTSHLDRFTVIASAVSPEPASQGIRTQSVEAEWTPYIGPTAMLFARKLDHALSNLKNSERHISVIVHRWAADLGVYPEEIIAARNRLIRWAFATWEDKGNIMSLNRNWGPVPACVKTPEHRAVLMAIPDIVFPVASGIADPDATPYPMLPALPA
jgi:hypothetical protein